ncbi:MAG: SDR family oxidoreductase [Pseudomonadota bacterium]|nr:SDR family oxidoreductase [Pseudomonadota bacterium]
MSFAFSLLNRRILITGGARGLGRSFAEATISAGAKVSIADILVEEGRKTAEEIGADYHELDLGDPASISNCMENVANAQGGIDGLINNAAIATGIGGPSLDEIEINTWDQVMSINVRGSWLMTRAALPYLREVGNGKIINLASDTALWGAPNLLHYVASKGAVISMTRSMARELGPDGIAVNSIAPGLTKVEATEYVPSERKQHYVENRPFKRTQLPNDLTGAIVFFMSNASDFVTGQCLPINGGFIMN